MIIRIVHGAILLAFGMAAAPCFGAAPKDILIADFEGAGYGAWKATGDAFGSGPAQGALANQMAVSGYLGKGLVNSFHKGDAGTGTLTSPEFTIARKHINLLVGGGDTEGQTAVLLLVDGKLVRTVGGANSENLTWRTWDVAGLKGRRARIQVVDRATGGWGHISVDQIAQSDARRSVAPAGEPLLKEAFRPRYHYTPIRNFMNDPNGLVYHDGEYHAFHQYNPEGNRWGHMSWNHAVSADMVHWKHLSVALKEEDGVMIFSGSAVVDTEDTSGFGKPGQPAMVAVYTGHRVADEMQSQCLAYSTDRGRTWTKYANNPVIGWEKDFRDPKVFWHAPTSKWVMAVVKADQKVVRLYGSKDLKDWTLLSTFGPAGVPVAQKPNWECPDLFPLPIEGEKGASKWVLHVGMGGGHIAGGSGGEYFIGEFDGTTFRNDNPPETVLWEDYGKDNYAAISFDGVAGPNGERYWLGWMSNWQYANDVPTSPWRNGFTLPRALSLRRTPEGLRMIQKPVAALQKLRQAGRKIAGQTISSTRTFIPAGVKGDTLEIVAEFEVGTAREFGLAVRKGPGEQTLVGYDVEKGALFVDRTRSGRSDFNPAFAGRHSGPMPARNGRVKLHLFVDRASVEVFGNSGETVITELIFPKPESQGVQVYARNGSVRLIRMDTWSLKPAVGAQAMTTSHK